MDWELEIEGEIEHFETREELLERIRDLLEDHLATTPLADAEVRDPFGNELEIDLGLRLVSLED